MLFSFAVWELGHSTTRQADAFSKFFRGRVTLHLTFSNFQNFAEFPNVAA
jgi:hypothetical protein